MKKLGKKVLESGKSLDIKLAFYIQRIRLGSNEFISTLIRIIR